MRLIAFGRVAETVESAVMLLAAVDVTNGTNADHVADKAAPVCLRMCWSRFSYSWWHHGRHWRETGSAEALILVKHAILTAAATVQQRRKERSWRWISA